MFIFTSKGFISVVQSSKDSNELMVRARREGDLKSLFPNHEPIHTPNADYPWRIFIKRVQFIAVMIDQIGKISYFKFKPTTSGDYHDLLVQVWARGLYYQDRESGVSLLAEYGDEEWPSIEAPIYD